MTRAASRAQGLFQALRPFGLCGAATPHATRTLARLAERRPSQHGTGATGAAMAADGTVYRLRTMIGRILCRLGFHAFRETHCNAWMIATRRVCDRCGVVHIHGYPIGSGWRNEVGDPYPGRASECWCMTCRPITVDDMRFVVCPVCGNKRCPKANDHRHDCTGINEPGQKGSAWEGVSNGRG